MKSKFIASEKVENCRLDTFLTNNIEDKSRNYCQKVIEEGGVIVNGKVCTSKKEKVNQGDIIEIEVTEKQEITPTPEKMKLNIVYEDEDILVLDKDKGVVVHPGVGNYTGTLMNGLLYYCGDNLSDINGDLRRGIVHRIDKDTSGLIMIAKSNFAHEGLAEQLANHSSTRGYKAVVYNNFKEDEGTINKPIGRNKKNRLLRAVDYENGKRAVTHYKVLERLSKFCLIEARLETGRTHQIRVHMADINHPLLGDVVYGQAKQKYKLEGQMLHAYLLGFIHPRTGQYMEFESELPSEFINVLDKLRKE
ncbi:MAG: RluA family pseudouridine synthase [Anaerovoracaceae bacterium]